MENEHMSPLARLMAFDANAIELARNLAVWQPRGDYTIDQLQPAPGGPASSDEVPLYRNGQTFKANVGDIANGGTIVINPLFFSVLDYGAKGDGVHDDTLAFSKAIAAAQAAAQVGTGTYATGDVSISAWTAASGLVSVGVNINGVLVTGGAHYNDSLATLTTNVATAINTSGIIASVATAVANSPVNGEITLNAVQIGVAGNNVTYYATASATVGLVSAPPIDPDSMTYFTGGQNTVSVGGAVVYAPPGDYNLASADDSTLAFTVPNVYFQGAYVNASKILLPPNTRGFSWTNITAGGMRDVAIRYTANSGSKEAVYCNNSSYFLFSNVSIGKAYVGFHFFDGGTYMLDHCQVNMWTDGMGNGSKAGVWFDGQKRLGPQGCIVSNSHFGGSSGATGDAFLIERGGGLFFIALGILRPHHGFNICPVNAVVNNVNITSVNVDAATGVPILVAPGTGGFAIKIHMTDTYAKTAGSSGIVFKPAASTGIIADLALNGLTCYNNRGNGLQIESPVALQVRGISIVGGVFTGNGAVGVGFAGINIIGPCDNISITGANCSGWTADNTKEQQNIGIRFSDGGYSGNPTNVSLIGNNVRNNATKGIEPGSGFSFIDKTDYIADNAGFNPWGLAAVPAIPASTTDFVNPYGCTAHVYITGGTVTLIKLKGTNPSASYVNFGTTSGFVILGPGEIINLTYSAAPSWVWALL